MNSTITSKKWSKFPATLPPNDREVLAKTYTKDYLIAYYNHGFQLWYQMVYNDIEPYPTKITERVIEWKEIPK